MSSVRVSVGADSGIYCAGPGGQSARHTEDILPSFIAQPGGNQGTADSMMTDNHDFLILESGLAILIASVLSIRPMGG